MKAEFRDVSPSVLCGECGSTLCSHFPVCNREVKIEEELVDV